MASVQQVHSAKQFSEKEKSAIGEAMKEAQNNIKNANASQDQLFLVTGVMKNHQPRATMLMKNHSWKGKFIANPPEKMADSSGAFVHQGAAALGELPEVVSSKCVLIYGHYDKALPNLGWLLAWDKPADNLTNKFNKVYVEAGDLSRLMKMELSEIEQKLEASHDISRYWDSGTGASAAAEIKNAGDNMALLGATFDQIS